MPCWNPCFIPSHSLINDQVWSPLSVFLLDLIILTKLSFLPEILFFPPLFPWLKTKFTSNFHILFQTHSCLSCSVHLKFIDRAGMAKLSILFILMFLCYVISVKLHEDLAMLSFRTSLILQGKIITVTHGLLPGLCQMKLSGPFMIIFFYSSLISLISKYLYLICNVAENEKIFHFSMIQPWEK